MVFKPHRNQFSLPILKPLEQTQLAIRRGDLDPLRNVPDLPLALRQVIQKNFDLGVAMSEALSGFMAMVRKALEASSECSRLRLLILTRWLIVVLLGLCLRLFFILALDDNASPMSQGFIEIARQFLAPDLQGGLILATWGLGLILMAFPNNWLWKHDTWSLTSLEWLDDFISGLGLKHQPWSKLFEIYVAQEFHSGVSLRTEKKQVLLDFAQQESDSYCKRLKLLEELLPLWELFILAPALFILAAEPATRWILKVNI